MRYQLFNYEICSWIATYLDKGTIEFRCRSDRIQQSGDFKTDIARMFESFLSKQAQLLAPFIGDQRRLHGGCTLDALRIRIKNRSHVIYIRIKLHASINVRFVQYNTANEAQRKMCFD